MIMVVVAATCYRTFVFIHVFIQQILTERLICAGPGCTLGDTTVDKVDRNLCFHGTYILVGEGRQ